MPGLVDKGDVLCARGECRDVSAVVVAPAGFCDVVMVRGWDGDDCAV